MKRMKTKVAILGAGCSCSYGYPLANQMKDHLRDFAKRIETSAPKLYKLTQDTIALFDSLAKRGSPAQTLDDAAWLVHQNKIPTTPGTPQDEYNDRLVNDAKAAVSAMFLANESEALAKGLIGYRSLLRRVFPNRTHVQRALVESPWRVLTFNYDRLFELAFRQHFDVDMSETFYGPTRLNSGLRLVIPEQVEVNTGRFSLLKLHGSVGFWTEHFGGCHHYHTIPDPTKSVPITDEEFVFANRHGIHSNRPKTSLIVFPHEKSHLRDYPSNTFPFRYYIPEIWQAAKEFMSDADEVWIIGYSLPESDWSPLEFLLKSAPETSRIVVQNPSASGLSAKLQSRLPTLAGRITACPSRFEE
jgi:hypothetical protein